MKAYVLFGEGLHCSIESLQFWSSFSQFSEVVPLEIPRLRRTAISGDFGLDHKSWLFIPGGFSFADHFGSGLLLSSLLTEIGFFAYLEQKRISVLGVCNGFQVLARSGIFGGISLAPNHSDGKPMGFVNRWTHLECGGPLTIRGESAARIRLPVRHGEGALHGWSKRHPDCVGFLKFVDFDNGSEESITGVLRIQSGRVIVGMMPHPEIADRADRDPSFPGPDFLVSQGRSPGVGVGDGRRLMESIFSLHER